MAVYRFRVTFEDQEDVYREIEIRANQTFEDLHYVILQSVGFDTQHNASFYMSDDYWRKGQEITLNAPPSNDDDDDVPRLKRKAPPKLMKQSKLAAFIEDPHQKIVYIYDPKANWVLNIELVKIVTEDSKTSYPKCVKTVGPAPKQYKIVTPPPVVAEDDDEGGSQKEAIFTEVETYETGEDDDEPLTVEEGEETEVEGEESSEGEEGFDVGAEDFGEEGSEDR
jgi:hypothetical protein